MTKKFLKDNRGQVLYAVLVTVMFLGVLSMITMGLTLQHYHAAQQKQAHVTDYYAADAVAELLRIGEISVSDEEKMFNPDDFTEATDYEDKNNVYVKKDGTHNGGEGDDAFVVNTYIITKGTVTLTVEIQTPTVETKAPTFVSWEVSYHAVETQAEPDPAE